jgi:hypothetical protein
LDLSGVKKNGPFRNDFVWMPCYAVSEGFAMPRLRGPVLLTCVIALYNVAIILSQAPALSDQYANGIFAAVPILFAIPAALIIPRQRIQAVIDRRFFRQKYITGQAIARFALASRNNMDLDALTSMLMEIPRETLQPTQVSLYVLKKK